MNEEKDSHDDQKSASSEDKDVNEYSFIVLFLDTFNLKKFIKKFLVEPEPKRFTITEKLIDIILLIIFLAFIFWETGILTLDKTPTMITLGTLVIVALVEFIVANSNLLKGIFASDIKTKNFINRLPSLSLKEIKKEVRFQKFSPVSLNYFIEQLRDANKHSPKVTDIILNSQSLRKVNIDLLLDPGIIKNIDQNIIIKILCEYENNLTEENIKNIYNSYSYNTDITKTLFATQEKSHFLVSSHPNDHDLNEYYEMYQNKKVHLDRSLNLINIDKLDNLPMNSFLYLFLFFGVFGILYETYVVNRMLSLDALITIFLMAAFLAFMIAQIAIVYLKEEISSYYYTHLLEKIKKFKKM